MEVTRIFDILEHASQFYTSKNNLFAGKINGEWKKYSVADYTTMAHNLSYGLLELGLVKGDRVASISNNRPEWNFLDMALNQAGMLHVPIYPTISDSDYVYILKHCNPKLLFVSDKAMYQRLQTIASEVDSIISIYTFNEIESAAHWYDIYELGKSKADKYKEILRQIKESILPEDVATLIYTSGTTGNAKGVMLTHKNILSNIRGINQVFNFNESDTTLSFLPISHVFERTINYYFQLQGVSIYYAESLSTISANLKEIKPTVFIAVPRVLESVYDKIIGVGKDLPIVKKHIFFWAVNLGLRFDYTNVNGWFYRIQLKLANRLVFSKWREAIGGRVRLIVVGGAAMQPRLIRVFSAAGMPLVEGYGMTETSPVIAANNLDAGEIMIGTVGPVFPGMEVKINPDGEIMVKGESVMKGYYKEDEVTKSSFDPEGWFHTGDIGMLVDNKYLKITDRKKEMFKLSSGKYIAPQIIENKLKESFFIEQVMVVGENEKFASALISPNFPFLHNWCSLHGVKFRDNTALIADKQVIARYQKEVNEINKQLGLSEQIKRFRLVVEEWTQTSGDLSPTLKLKRRVLNDKYAVLLSEIYSGQKSGEL